MMPCLVEGIEAPPPLLGRKKIFTLLRELA